MNAIPKKPIQIRLNNINQKSVFNRSIVWNALRKYEQSFQE